MLSKSFIGTFAMLAGLLLVTGGLAAMPNSSDPLWVPEDIDAPVEIARQGDYEAALAAADEQVASLTANFGPESFQAARALDIWAKVMQAIGRDSEPEVILAVKNSLRIKEKLLGPDHVEVAFSYHNLGSIQFGLGDREAAKTAYEKSLAIHQLQPEPDLGAMASSSQGIAISLASSGHLAEAVPYFEQSVAQLEIAAPNTAKLAGAYANMGTLHKILGEFDEARLDLDGAIAIYSDLYGSQSPQLSTPYYSRATISLAMGQLDAAEADFRRALTVNEAADADHPQNAAVQTGLGLLQMELGALTEARERFTEGLRILEVAYGYGHPNAAYHYANLSDINYRLGDYKAATKTGQSAVEIHGENLGLQDPITARAQLRLAQAQSQTDPAGAAVRADSAYAILLQEYGPDHDWTSGAAFAVASLAALDGDLSSALAAATAAVDGYTTVFGDHLDVATSRALRSRIEFGLGNYDAAFTDGSIAEIMARAQFRIIVQSRSEQAAAKFSQVRSSGLGLMLSTLSQPNSPAGNTREAWDSVIRSRGLLMDELLARRRAARLNQSPEVVQLTENVRQARIRLADIYVRGPSEMNDFQRRYEEASAAKEIAEIALAQKSREFRQQTSESEIGLAEVEQALPAGGALLSYVRYEQQETAVIRAPHYGALVLGSSGTRFVPLGEAAIIDRAIAAWRTSMAEGRIPLGPLSELKTAQNRLVGDSVRHLIWDPIADDVINAETIFIVPDGELHLVEFAALPTAEGDYFVETAPLFHYLSAEKQLAQRHDQTRGRGLLAVGDPDFDAQKSGLVIATLDAQSHQITGVLRGPPECDSFRSLEFWALPETARECENIVAIWQAQIASEPHFQLAGAAATESAFKTNAPGMRVLHLATHGYFLKPDCRDEVQASVTVDPLLLSGLALAGANQRANTVEGQEDGILTAEEVAVLDLNGVEWAVLSACETGVGEILDGEGVYGLRRAFEAAGAATVIMSLWPVGDEETEQWMTSTYTARFKDGQSTAQAVRQSSLKALKNRRALGLSPHPIWWSGFVATGDWR